ncbi:ABC transporter substrate-binding protein [Niveispirillum sp.]|uniref:ABC transporter substrate-binding protein n=1 Tax=Niveispirillum sp. TaxID=1917217 RepID=UPI001B5DB1A2|nr:ABC transporter substrate-binding protein [Niveispirillum sp.]MBP7340420.1 ABC transporter substrate-binding protein [Niveispirillum sp.]
MIVWRSWKLLLATFLLTGLAVGGMILARGNGTKQHLVVAESRQMMSALIFVAQADGYFAEQGLSVEIMPVANGKLAMEALMDSRSDLALSSDVPAAGAMLAGKPIRILSTVQTSDRDIVIASPSGSGLTSPATLAGKRVGFSPDTNSQHFLDLLITQSGLTGMVTVVPIESDRIMQALADGQIDAASVWTTVRVGGAALFPKGLDILSMPGLYTGSWILSARRDVVETKRDALVRFERALLAAEWSILKDRERAIPIVAAGTGIDETLVRSHWESYGFTLRLDQALLLSLEGHLRRAGGNPGPEMLGYLQSDILREVDPTRVTVLD